MPKLAILKIYDAMRMDYLAYRNCHPKIWTIASFFFTNPGFRAVIFYRLQQHFSHSGNYRIALAFSNLNQFLTGAEFCVGCEVGTHFRVRHPAGIVIGGNVRLGRNIILQQNVTIGEKYSNASTHSGSPVLGDDVTVGANSVLIGPINIGSSITIGALSLVNSSFKNPGVIAGIPAKYVKKFK